jgi:hypothetical protein
MARWLGLALLLLCGGALAAPATPGPTLAAVQPISTAAPAAPWLASIMFSGDKGSLRLACSGALVSRGACQPAARPPVVAP